MRLYYLWIAKKHQLSDVYNGHNSCCWRDQACRLIIQKPSRAGIL